MSLIIRVFRMVAAGVLLGLTLIHPVRALAQAGLEWAPPDTVYEGMVTSHMTALVSDPFGAAHLVWKLADEETYYYCRWDGTAWTAPLDIIAVTPDVGLSPPALVAAADGSLHLFWARDGIMHSWAWADNASKTARAWSVPEAIVVPNSAARDTLDAKQDDSGAFHLVFPAGHDIYYVHSDSDGQEWTEPVAVRRAEGATRMSAPRLDVGPGGRVHVVWEEWPLDSELFDSSEVYYAHTSDGGRSWSKPRQLGELANRGGNILASEDGSVYLAWQAGVVSPNQGRFLQRSPDGGDTWEVPINFSRVRGQSGHPRMARDSQKTLHIITGDGEYASWNGESMSTPVDLRPVARQTENARLTILNGNQVLVVMGPFDGPGLYYTVKDLPLPPLPTLAAPDTVSSRTTPSPAASEGISSSRAPTADATFEDSNALPPDRSVSSTVPVLVFSIGLSVALVAGVLVVQLSRSRR